MRPSTELTRAPVGVAASAWFGAFALSVVAAQVVIAATGHRGQDATTLPFSVTAAGMVAQWIPMVAMLVWVSRRHLTGSFATDYALRFRPVDLLGIPIGVLTQLVLLELLYWPLARLFETTFSRDELQEPARKLTDRADGGWKVVLVVAVVVAAPVVEELVYRGLILRALDARIADGLALVASALWFAAVHVQAVQFFGLFAVGVVLGLCLQRTGRLGMSILAHAAFNATSLALLW